MVATRQRKMTAKFAQRVRLIIDSTEVTSTNLKVSFLDFTAFSEERKTVNSQRLKKATNGADVSLSFISTSLRHSRKRSSGLRHDHNLSSHSKQHREPQKKTEQRRTNLSNTLRLGGFNKPVTFFRCIVSTNRVSLSSV